MYARMYGLFYTVIGIMKYFALLEGLYRFKNVTETNQPIKCCIHDCSAGSATGDEVNA